jgi:hypothetical protein
MNELFDVSVSLGTLSLDDGVITNVPPPSSTVLLVDELCEP